MSIALLSLDGVMFLARWMHFFFGIIWIGLLYYFNYVHGAFMAEADAAAKPSVVTKLLPRALWWFRYGALWTWVSGVLILMMKGHQAGWSVYATSWGATILTGALLATLMFLNVWLIIWPNQQVVIASAEAVAKGGQANPNVAVHAGKALLASRTNTLFSIPMLFFMGAASHLPIQISENSSFSCVALVVGVIAAAIEANAIKGKLGPIATIKGVITFGFVLAAVLYAALEICL